MAVVGLLAGMIAGRLLAPAGVADRGGALRLSAGLPAALEAQLSGRPGPVGIALSFRDRDGHWCRAFRAQHLDGVACKQAGDWWLRYGAPVAAQDGDHGESAALIAAMMAGRPLDADGERAARRAGWE